MTDRALPQISNRTIVFRTGHLASEVYSTKGRFIRKKHDL